MNISLKAARAVVFGCDKRFRVLVAGRRFGKTYLAMVELIRAAWGSRPPGVVRRSNQQTVAANHLEIAQKDDEGVLGIHAERNGSAH